LRARTREEKRETHLLVVVLELLATDLGQVAPPALDRPDALRPRGRRRRRERLGLGERAGEAHAARHRRVVGAVAAAHGVRVLAHVGRRLTHPRRRVRRPWAAAAPVALPDEGSDRPVVGAVPLAERRAVGEAVPAVWWRERGPAAQDGRPHGRGEDEKGDEARDDGDGEDGVGRAAAGLWASATP